MAEHAVCFEQDGPVALVTLNRPEVRNCANPEMIVRLAQIWQQVRDDDAVRVAVITATGSAFCAGMDMKSVIPLITGARPAQDEWDRELLANQEVGGRAMLRDVDVVKPVIAAINGLVMGGGLELVLGCDLRVAVAGAQFALPEAKWAVFPGGGGTVRLPRQIPYARAMEMLLTGDSLAAEEMLQLGFLNRVVAETELLDTAMEIARKIAANGPLAVQAIRRSVRSTAGLSEAEALAREAELAAPVYASEDAKEGPRAFMEKRAPVFNGR